jgi:hypothetical protein
LRSTRQFFIDIVKKPPVLFPLVALFHVLWLIWTIWSDRYLHFPDLALLEVCWMIGYTVFWIVACDFRKWGALGYFALTLVNTCIYLAVRNGKLPAGYESNMFLLDGLFSVFLLIYYKRFN